MQLVTRPPAAGAGGARPLRRLDKLLDRAAPLILEAGPFLHVLAQHGVHRGAQLRRPDSRFSQQLVVDRDGEVGHSRSPVLHRISVTRVHGALTVRLRTRAIGPPPAPDAGTGPCRTPPPAPPVPAYRWRRWRRRPLRLRV